MSHDLQACYQQHGKSRIALLPLLWLLAKGAYPYERRLSCMQRASGFQVGLQAFEYVSRARRQGPHRLVVRTSRCGRDNPGSTPGVDIFLECQLERHAFAKAVALQAAHAIQGRFGRAV